MLDQEFFYSETKAREFLEGLLWPQGPHCAHCVSARVGALQGKSHRAGLWKCYACRKPFTIRHGTIFESSHIPLHKWLQGIYLLCSSKKGMSSNQLSRTLGLTLKSAWFMSHRIREAMSAPQGIGKLMGIVEVDETYFGKKASGRPPVATTGLPFTKAGRGGPSGKLAIISMVERGGEIRSFYLPTANKSEIQNLITAQVDPDSNLYTDESKLYGGIGAKGYRHDTVRHSVREYARGEVHTNTVEGAFGLFKRGMRGIYQHCDERHLHRYLAEFDFRYNHRAKLGVDDLERTKEALRATRGRRLTGKALRGKRAAAGAN